MLETKLDVLEQDLAESQRQLKSKEVEHKHELERSSSISEEQFKDEKQKLDKLLWEKKEVDQQLQFEQNKVENLQKELQRQGDRLVQMETEYRQLEAAGREQAFKVKPHDIHIIVSF
mgnify:CR=1 FL=1